MDLIKTFSYDAQQSVEANREALRLARTAVGLERVDWKQQLSAPLTWTTYPQLSEQRRVGKMLCTAALYEHSTGNDSECLEIVHDALHLSYAVSGDFSTFIHCLSTIAVQAVALDVIEQSAADIRFDAPPYRDSEEARARLKHLIDMLLDDTQLHESWRRAYYGERLQAMDMRSSIMSAAGPSIQARLREPILIYDVISCMNTCTHAFKAGGHDIYPEAREYFDSAWRSDYAVSGSFHVLPTDMMAPSYKRGIQLYFRLIALRRMSAAALALRLYELDRGERPRVLADLVPDYLAALPADPFSRAAAPLLYLPDATPPILYSVGLDGVDDGGEYALTEHGTPDQDKLDMAYFLDGDRPRMVPTHLAEMPCGPVGPEDLEKEGED